MATDQEFYSDIAIPPGEYLVEVVNELGMTQAELASRMGRPIQAINEICKGDKAITPETALQLEQVLPVPAHIWAGLESEYQLVKARQQAIQNISDEVDLVKEFPYSKMTKLGWVEPTRKPIERVRELRKFFAVASLANLEDVRAYGPAFRQSENPKMSANALAAWLRGGRLVAETIDTAPYDKARLRAALPTIRALTLEKAEIFAPRLQDVLAAVGVAFVLLPHLSKTYTNGATFWLNSKKAVLMMSIRGSWTDIFWFSLFHDLGHILLHGTRHTFLENGSSKSPEWQRQEKEANEFAQAELIPPTAYKRFLEGGRITSKRAESFARDIGVQPGIVVGRLQHDKYLGPDTLNGLRKRLGWAQ